MQENKNPNDLVCDLAYRYAQMDRNGDIFFCCPPWVNFYSIGNITKNTFSEIWNGEKAREFRRQFIENDFKYCNTDICIKIPIKCGFEYPPKSDIAPNKPDIFIFNYDSICNIRCIFCRDACQQKSTRFDYFEDNMDTILEDMLENCKTVTPSTAGESLFSPATVRLIKKINEKFPDIGYSITSNGLLVTEEYLKKLNIINKLHYLSISVHATTKETYNKIVQNSDFDKIKDNLKFISDLKKDGIVPGFRMNFVINAYNYKEMPDFVEWAYSLGADVAFLQLLDSEIDKDIFKKINIFNKEHPKYNDFCDILKNPIFKTSHCITPDGLLNLKKVHKPLFVAIKDNFMKY